jgi:hypothetical protein
MRIRSMNARSALMLYRSNQASLRLAYEVAGGDDLSHRFPLLYAGEGDRGVGGE